MPSASSIDDVLSQLAEVVAGCAARGDAAGLFAALYRQVTARVKAHVVRGDLFEDGPRMERFDTVFANRYLAAWDAYQAGLPMSRAWQVAFDAVTRGDRLMLQYVLLGINAHINLDLAVAAAEVSAERGDPIDALERDFVCINDILVSLLEDTQATLGRYSPALLALDWLSGKGDEVLGVFSIAKMRARAWEMARLLAEIDPACRGGAVRLLDYQAATFARLVIDPPTLSPAVRLLRHTERAQLGEVILALDGVEAGLSGRKHLVRLRDALSWLTFSRMGVRPDRR